MIKRIKKIVVSMIAVGILFGGTFAAPVEAGVIAVSTNNTSLGVKMEFSRNSNNVVIVTPMGRRVSQTAYSAIRNRVEYNVITVNSQGIASNNIRQRNWNIRNNPTRSTHYSGNREQMTIRQGYIETQVQRRTNSIGFFGGQIQIRRTFQ